MWSFFITNCYLNTKLVELHIEDLIITIHLAMLALLRSLNFTLRFDYASTAKSD